MKLKSVLNRAKTLVQNDKNLTEDINEALDILSINEKDNILIPNVNYRRKVYNRHHVEERTKESLQRKLELERTSKELNLQKKTENEHHHHLVSFVFNLHLREEGLQRSLLGNITANILKNNYSVIVASDNQAAVSSNSEQHLMFLKTEKNWSDGKVWNKLVQNVKTPFVLVGRDITMFTGQENITRLLEVAPSIGSPIIGGATRTVEDGHWTLNCFQMLHHNYSIFYQSGYHKSDQSCLYCDFFWGPFLAEKEFLVSHPFSETMTPQLVFHDFFFKLNAEYKYTSSVCPDVMFEISQDSKQFPTKAGWYPMAKEHFINRIKHPDGSSVIYSCDELGQTIHEKWEVGKMKSPCDLGILTHYMKLFYSLCEEMDGLVCYMADGGLLGKVDFLNQCII